MKTITIEITAKDIRRGKPGSYTQCPIAFALRRRLRPDVIPWVGYFAIEFRSVDLARSFGGIVTSSVLKHLIARYDDDRTMAPGRIRLRLPDGLAQYLR